VIAVVRDITDRHTFDMALRESEQKFRNVVEASPLGMQFYGIGSTGNLVLSGANPSADRILRIRHAELVGKSIEEAFPPLKDTEVPWRCALSAQEGVPWHSENVIYKEGDAERVFEVYAVQTQPGAMVAFFHDVTRRRQDEEDRRQVQTRIQETQRLESLGVLAGGIAHDFNNILMTVRGNAETLQRGRELDGEGKEALRGIETATQRAKDLCRQLLAYAGQGKFSIEVLDLRQVAAEIGRMIGVGMSKKAKLEYRFAEVLPNVRGDATQLRQVLLNLMTNASEALGDGPGTVTVSLRGIKADESEAALEPGDYVELVVEDTGSGMDAETQSRIFEPFFTTKFAGRGLGLAAVRGIVHSHQGVVRVRSSPGKGTVLSVFLPAASEELAPVAPGEPKEVPGVFRGQALLADDDEDVRIVTRRMLERLGFKVLESSEGRQALQMANDSGKDLAVVVLDLTMPGLDGAEVFRGIRRSHPKLPVVLASGYSPEDVAERIRDDSPHALLQKPFTQLELSQALRKAGVG
jgi:PAS domain S-box-containing protein